MTERKIDEPGFATPNVRASIVTERVGALVAGFTNTAIGVTELKNENGVPLEAIESFINGLKFKFGIVKEVVLNRLVSSLTKEKLRTLSYFNQNGHELDVTGITADGALEFSTCSIDSPKGEHWGKNYFKTLSLVLEHGAKLMTREKYKWLQTQNVVFDVNTLSWVESLYVETAGVAAVGCNGEVIAYEDLENNYFPGACRVTIEV